MAKARKKRAALNPLSLSFLDVMSVGFGAVVLLFLILDHNASDQRRDTDSQTAAEAELLTDEIQQGEENLVQLRNTLAQVSLEVVEAEGRADRIQQEIDSFRQQLASLEGETTASEESVEDLQSDIQSLEQEIQRLEASAVEETGSSAREFLGEGQRQYLSGLYLGGNRILILLDVSASMLDETLVNVLRIRNMEPQQQRNARKWRRALEIVDWITSQLPVASQYQVYGYNEQVTPILEDTRGQWLEVADRAQLNTMVSTARDELLPGGGNNLQQAFQAAASMSPPPDNIYLITDSLPTLANGSSTEGQVTPRQRLDRYWQAVDTLPDNIPVNTILLPMEGDPAAAAAYWQLATLTSGSFLTPSQDWP